MRDAGPALNELGPRPISKGGSHSVGGLINYTVAVVAATKGREPRSYAARRIGEVSSKRLPCLEHFPFTFYAAVHNEFQIKQNSIAYICNLKVE